MDDSATATSVWSKDATGIPGMDEILFGGFTRSRMYLVEGVPGAGKTTLAIQYLIEGARRGESVLYVSLAESREELDEIAASHGWSLDGVHIRELVASEASLRPDEQYTMFHPSEVELGETTRQILAEVDALKPTRVVFDSLSELRLLAGNALRYRRQILALKQFFVGRRSTVIVLDDVSVQEGERHVHTVVHGIVRLEQLNPEYGAERRRLTVLKYRASQYLGGYHDFVIRRGGLEVFPRLRAKDHASVSVEGMFRSGIGELDALLGGGIIPGTSTLIVGAAGTGKSSIAAQFAAACGARGDKAAMFIFDENRSTLMARCNGLAIDLGREIDAGRVTIQQASSSTASTAT
jgi:circadian clock protein KaiC